MQNIQHSDVGFVDVSARGDSDQCILSVQVKCSYARVFNNWNNNIHTQSFWQRWYKGAVRRSVRSNKRKKQFERCQSEVDRHSHQNCSMIHSQSCTDVVLRAKVPSLTFVLHTGMLSQHQRHIIKLAQKRIA